MSKHGNDNAGMLGLFPTFEEYGGVQASGRIAWEGIVTASTQGGEHAERRAQNAYLFCYGSQGVRVAEDVTDSIICATSKRRAIIAALRAQWPVRNVLVWHLALLKLLPFFRIRDAKLTLFLHGIEAWQQQDWASRALMRRVDLFLSNSDYTWERFLEINPGHRHSPHSTVHLGIASPLNGSVSAPLTPPAALMVSRLLKSEDYKGHREVINAWPIVLKRIPDAELWIVGEGDLRVELEQLTAVRGLQTKVRFWGQLSEEKKQELLQRCRCLALPSRGEGFGLVYLEAMRMGRPCLVSTLDAGREVVRPPQAGLAVNLDNSEEIAGALCRLLSGTPEWNEWSLRTKRYYEENFTAQHFQERLSAALFRNV